MATFNALVVRNDFIPFPHLQLAPQVHPFITIPSSEEFFVLNELIEGPLREGYDEEEPLPSTECN